MADRGTKDVLLRLRRVRELELRRELVVERADRAAARRDMVAAETARRRVETQLTSASARATSFGAPVRAGRLAHAVGYARSMDETLKRARNEQLAASRKLDRAEARLSAAQKALGDAVHARTRSESMLRADNAADTRSVERREQAETEDRWRPAAVRRSRF
ncbi:MAG: hypothetical protein ABI321_07245 [Polyangia bacterium]